MKTTLRTTALHSAYSLASMPLAIAAFTVVLTMLSVGVGMAITVIGIPIVVLAGILARGFAHAERSMLRSFVGASAPTPHYRKADPDVGWLKRSFTTLADPQTWLDVAFALVRLPLGIASFTLVVVWWSMALGGLTWPLWGWTLPRGPENTNLPELIGLGDSYPLDSVFYLAIGIFSVLTLRYAVLVATWIHAGPAVLMLSSRAELQEAAHAARESRDAGRTAQARALRRLERDIHDGPQQQLVRLSMDLGRARRQLDADPELARHILDVAVRRSTETLDELRALSRGIAPPLLVDRGLEAALQEIVDRAPIPVHLQYNLGDEPLSEHVETAAYFVVSEALTNMAKHAQASYGSVHVDEEQTSTGRVITVAVADDGVGGAHLAKGSGLSGLADRVRSVDGVFDVQSPEGGPTFIVASVPCG